MTYFGSQVTLECLMTTEIFKSNFRKAWLTIFMTWPSLYKYYPLLSKFKLPSQQIFRRTGVCVCRLAMNHHLVFGIFVSYGSYSHYRLSKHNRKLYLFSKLNQSIVFWRHLKARQDMWKVFKNNTFFYCFYCFSLTLRKVITIIWF